MRRRTVLAIAIGVPVLWILAVAAAVWGVVRHGAGKCRDHCGKAVSWDGSALLAGGDLVLVYQIDGEMFGVCTYSLRPLGRVARWFRHGDMMVRVP